MPGSHLRGLKMARGTHRIPVGGGESLALDWYPGTAGEPAALFVQGLGSHRRGEKALYFAQRFNSLGWAFAAVDLRGHGDSDGTLRELTMSRMVKDVEATREWLEMRGIGPRPVLIGSSIGGAAIAWHTARHAAETRALVMLGPSLYFPAGLAAAIGATQMQEWERAGVRRWRSRWIDVEVGFGLMQDAPAYDVRDLMRRLRCPTLVFHGMEDEVVDWRETARFLQHCSSRDMEMVALKDGDHRLTAHKALIFDLLWAWLAHRT